MSGSPFLQKTSVKKNQNRFHQLNPDTDIDPNTTNNNTPIKEYNHITTCLYTHSKAQQPINEHNIPNNFVVGGILAALSAAIGNSVKIYTKDQSNSASIFIILVGGSGTGKTPAIERLLAPLQIIEDRITIDYKMAYSNWKKNKDTEGIHSGTKPVKESLKITGGNMEGILKRLQDSPKGMIIATDELAGFFNSLNQYRKGDDVQTYLSIWSNQNIDVIRKNVDEGYLITRPFLSIMGGIQPGTFKKIIANIGSEDGFLWRFLPCINTVEKLPY